MKLILALFVPASIMVILKRFLFEQKQKCERKSILLEYILNVVLINFFVITIACLFYGNRWNIIGKLNTSWSFLFKYISLSAVIAVITPILCSCIKTVYLRMVKGINEPFLLDQFLKEDEFLPNTMFLISLFTCLVCVVLFNLEMKYRNNTSILIVWGCMILMYFLYIAMSGKRISIETIILLLFFTGLMLRLNYVLYTHADLSAMTRQHDVGSFAIDSNRAGHADYIRWFYNNLFKLPENPMKGQFYHPPFHHWIAALWMRLLSILGANYARAAASVQFLTLFYSACCMITTERILSILGINGSGKIAAFSIIAFHPTFIILAGSINNDILAILMILLSVYFTIKWYVNPTIKNIILIALSIAIGMATKITAAVVAPPIALIFLIKLIIERKKYMEYFKQYFTFGIICVPIGLYFPIYKLICYGVKLNYVHKLSVKSHQYVGHYSVFERLFDFSYNPFNNIYLNWGKKGMGLYEYNPFVALVKTSIFGEYRFAAKGTSLYSTSGMLLIINIVLILVSLIAALYFIRKNKVKWPIRAFITFYHTFLFAYYLIFCFHYPHTCSMDYRYIVPTCVLGSVYIGFYLNYLSEKTGQTKRKIFQFIRYLIVYAVGIFGLLSSSVYILLGV